MADGDSGFYEDPFTDEGQGGGGYYDPRGYYDGDGDDSEYDSGIAGNVGYFLGGAALGAGGAVLVEELLKAHEREGRRQQQGGANPWLRPRGRGGNGNVIVTGKGTPGGEQGGGIVVANLPQGFTAVGTLSAPMAPGPGDAIIVRAFDPQGARVTFNSSPPTDRHQTAYVARFGPVNALHYVAGWPPGY